MDTCYYCGEAIAEDDHAFEEVVELPTGDGWMPVHASGCVVKDPLPELLTAYGEAKVRLELAQAEVDRLKTCIDQALGGRELYVGCGFEVKRVEGTLMKKWDNKMLLDLAYALRQTDNSDMAEAIVACRFEEPRRGYLRIGQVKS